MEFRTEGRVSGGSQVSVRKRMSMCLSAMRSCRTAGLFSGGVMEEADLTLRREKTKEE